MMVHIIASFFPPSPPPQSFPLSDKCVPKAIYNHPHSTGETETELKRRGRGGGGLEDFEVQHGKGADAATILPSSCRSVL